VFITVEQVKAARALLSWSQEDLANHGGLTHNQISSFEFGRTKPADVLEAIYKAFLFQGITFLKNGVQLNAETVVSIEGDGWYGRLLDDVYLTLVDKKDAEMLLFFSIDKVSPPDINARLRKIRNAGIRMRQLVEDGDTYLMGPVNEYRYIPKDRFINYLTVVYGNKVAISMQKGTKTIVFIDEYLAISWRNIFEILWDQFKQPEKSEAAERF